MKQWPLRVTAILCGVLLLAGCGGPPPVTPRTEGFSCHTTMQYREMLVEGTLTCYGEKGATLSFSLPKSLQGVTLHWDGGGMAMELGGMRVQVPTDKVPESALIRCLVAALTADHSGGTLTEEGYVVDGEVDGTAYTLVCDLTAGWPLSLSVPSMELEAVFTDPTSTAA